MLEEVEVMETRNGFVAKYQDNFVVAKTLEELGKEVASMIADMRNDFKALAYAFESTCGNYQILFYVTKKTTIVEGWMKPREGDKWLTMGIVECDNHAESKEIEREFVNAHFPDRKKKKIFHTWKGEVIKEANGGCVEGKA